LEVLINPLTFSRHIRVIQLTVEIIPGGNHVNIKRLSFAVIVVLLIGGYYAYDQMTGNHIEIQDVFTPAESTPSVKVSEVEKVADAPAQEAAPVVNEEKVWTIQPESKVYISVTTSRETVNIEMSQVEGTWAMIANHPETMKADAKVNVATLTSGSGQRDGHVKGSLYLDIANHPDATFSLKSIENWPVEWIDGQTYAFRLKGSLAVKGIEKDVIWNSEASKEGEMLKMKGESKVTFADFGMNNPHTVGMNTQNDLTITLQLLLK
jgi:polyisoprenoid-binding protein YceI